MEWEKSMKYRKHLPSLMLSVGLTCLALTIGASLMQRSTKAGLKQREVPKIISKVSTLEVVSANINNQEKENATVVIEVRNNSDKPIIAIVVESGDDKDASGVSVVGFKSGDEPPSVVLKPYATLKIRMPLSNVKPGAPVKISGVMYLDGTEKGEEEAIGTLRRQKEHEKKSKGGGNPRK
jgi:hypothetical protein